MLGVVGVGGLALAIVIATRDPDAAPSPVTRATASHTPVTSGAPAAPAAPIAPAASPTPGTPSTGDAPTVDDVFRARGELTAAASEVLLAALDATDAVVVAEAANALIARGEISALPVLVGFDVIGRPWAAPSVIDALGRLAAVAEPEPRDDAIDRLLALMAEEKRRGARESQGNLLQIYEALGLTGDPRAVPPLERELLDPSVGTAPKVVVVQALVALRAQQSRGVLEQLRDQLATSAEGVGFEAELRRDLLAAIREALVQLS